jgi:hypothetical protein
VKCVEEFEEGTLLIAAAIMKVFLAITGVRTQWMHNIFN